MSEEQAKDDLESELRKYIASQELSDPFYISKNVSENAFDGFTEKKLLNELIADGKVLIDRNKMEDDNLKRLIMEVLDYDVSAE